MIALRKGGWLATAALLALLATAAQAGPGEVVTKASQSQAQAYLGSEHRDLVNAVATSHPKPADVERLRPALDWCDQRVSDATVTYVSVENDAQAADYREQHPDQRNIVLVDTSCPGAYKLAAYLAVEGGDMVGALTWLDKATAIAPLFAEAWLERGFILNQTAKPAEGAAAYRQALAMLERHPDADVQATALRGLGYSLVDLGDLAGARAAYEQSLRLDPGSETGKRELDYVMGELAKASPNAAPATIADPATPAASNRAASNPDAQKAIKLVRELESAPLGDAATVSRAWLIDWEASTKDVDILVCDATGLLSSKTGTYSAELVVQDMFGNAAWQLEHPEAKGDELAMQVAGVRSTLRAYEAILGAHPEARIASLDALLEQERAGTLETFMRPVVASKCSRKGAIDSKAL